MTGVRRQLQAAIIVLSGGLAIVPVGTASAQGDAVYRRADANFNGSIDISDAIYLLNFLFNGGPSPRCDGLADANASGSVDISDGIAILVYLFVNGADLDPLTGSELETCTNPPREAEVLRHGSLQPLAHDVYGVVEHLSDRTIRLQRFYYDGGGLPEVVVWLYKGSNDWAGYRISEDLRRDQPYKGEVLVFPIPEEITDEMFDHVAIWCTSFPQNYGYTLLFRN